MGEPVDPRALKLETIRHGPMHAGEEAVREHVLRVDDIWARESPLHEEWRKGGGEFGRSILAPLVEAFLRILASCRIYLKYLITAEAWLVCVISVASTLLFSLYKVNGQRLAVNVSWAFISFAIIFPLQNSLNNAFRRREQALVCLAELKAYLLSYYHGHRDWDWTDKNGRKHLPANHVSQIRFVVTQLIVDMRDILTCPPLARQTHFHTARGRAQRTRMVAIQRAISQRVGVHFDRISLAVEELKYAGQPGNESSRMRQYVTHAMKAWETLKFIKMYRTPIATRAFARVYIFLHPIFWGPYYAYLIEQMLNDADGSASQELYTVVCANAYACILSVLTSLAMMGLFNVRYQMEDPFMSQTRGGGGVDQIDVVKELGELLIAISREFKGADQNPSGGGPPRACYPLPEECAIACVEVQTLITLDNVTANVEAVE